MELHAKCVTTFSLLFHSPAEQQTTKTEPTISPKETVDSRSLNHAGLLPSNERQHIERLMAAQSAEVLAMEDELKAFRKNWEKSFRSLQERHTKEQERLFDLDNFGYEMWGNSKQTWRSCFQFQDGQGCLLTSVFLYQWTRSACIIINQVEKKEGVFHSIYLSYSELNYAIKELLFV